MIWWYLIFCRETFVLQVIKYSEHVKKRTALHNEKGLAIQSKLGDYHPK